MGKKGMRESRGCVRYEMDEMHYGKGVVMGSNR